VVSGGGFSLGEKAQHVVFFSHSGIVLADIETEGIFMRANGIKKVVETSGGINLREFTWWHPRKTMVMMRWLMENLKFHAKQPAMR
jgi:hypothetical protein